MSDETVTEAAETIETEVRTWEDGLSGRVRLFVLLYCTDQECFLNGTRAYKSAYRRKNRETGDLVEPDDNTAAVNASKMLRKTKVRESISMLLALARDETDDEAVHRILKHWGTLAFYNPADIITADGRLKVQDLSELGPLAVCVQGIERREGKYGTTINIKLSDRAPYMRDYAKYLNLIRPDTANLLTIPVVMTTERADVEKFNQAGDDGNTEPVAAPTDHE